MVLSSEVLSNAWAFDMFVFATHVGRGAGDAAV